VRERGLQLRERAAQRRLGELSRYEEDARRRSDR
jgi:hypothetical protein